MGDNSDNRVFTGFDKFFIVGLVTLFVILGLVQIRIMVSGKYNDLGVYCVRLMYEFSTPDELVANQGRLESILSADEFDRLCIDEPNRTINAYYKFQFSPSRVNIVNASEGYVEYTLENDYIDPNTHWVFLYSIESGRVTDVREYCAIVSEGTGGV